MSINFDFTYIVSVSVAHSERLNMNNRESRADTNSLAEKFKTAVVSR